MTRSRLLAVVIAASCLSAVLLATSLGREALWGDEGATWDATGRSLGDTLTMVRETETNGSLFHLLVKAARDAFGDDEWVLRLPSAVAAVATVAAVAALANVVAGRRAAALAAVVTAVHGSILHYGRDGRTYALLVLLVTLSYLGLVSDQREGRPLRLGLWVVAGAASVYVHLFAGLALVVQAAVLHPWFGPPEQRRRRFAGFVAMGALVLPLGAVIAARGELEEYDGPPIGLYIVREVAFTLSGGSWLVAAAAGLALLAAAVAVLRVPAGGTTPPEARDLRLLLLWAAVPATLGILLSIPERILVARYVLPSAVPLVVLVCWLAVRHARAWAGAAAVVLVALVGGVPAYAADDEHWDRLTDTMVAEAEPDDGVVFLDDMLVLVVDYYLQDRGFDPPAPAAPEAVVPSTPWGAFHLEDWDFPDVGRAAFDCAVQGRSRLWVIERDGIEEYEERYRMLAFAEEQFGPGEVRYRDDTLRLHLFTGEAAPPAPC